MKFKYEVPMNVDIDLEDLIKECNLSIDNIDKNFDYAFNSYMVGYDDMEYYTCDYIKDRVREEVLTILQEKGERKTKTYQIKFNDEYINIPCHGAIYTREETACWIAIDEFSRAYPNAWQNMAYHHNSEKDKFKCYVDELLEFGFIDGVVDIIEKEEPIHHLS